MGLHDRKFLSTEKYNGLGTPVIQAELPRVILTSQCAPQQEIPVFKVAHLSVFWFREGTKMN